MITLQTNPQPAAAADKFGEAITTLYRIVQQQPAAPWRRLRDIQT